MSGSRPVSHRIPPSSNSRWLRPGLRGPGAFSDKPRNRASSDRIGLTLSSGVHLPPPSWIAASQLRRRLDLSERAVYRESIACEPRINSWTRFPGAIHYPQWRNFLPVLDKAREACRQSGQQVEDHFADMRKMVGIGSGTQRPIDDARIRNVHFAYFKLTAGRNTAFSLIISRRGNDARLTVVVRQSISNQTKNE